MLRPISLFLAFLSLVSATLIQAQSTCTTLGPQCVQTFSDPSPWAQCYINRVAEAGIMPGCGGDRFCPDGVVTRSDMAVFLEDATHLGVPFAMPPAAGTFTDVPAALPLACWIEQLYRDGITTGCVPGVQYCPNDPVTRAQMAVFICRAKGWAAYLPPGGPSFLDVPADYWAYGFIERLKLQCITTGCDATHYCPEGTLTRAEMAAFMWRAFLASPSACTNPNCS